MKNQSPKNKISYFLNSFGDMLNFAPRRETRRCFELYCVLNTFHARDDMKMIERDFRTIGNDIKNAMVRFEHERV